MKCCSNPILVRDIKFFLRADVTKTFRRPVYDPKFVTHCLYCKKVFK